MPTRSTWLWLSIPVLILALAGCNSSAGLTQATPSPYEQRIKAIITKETAILETFDFKGDEVRKKRLLAAVALGLAVHSWEFYSYKGQAVERQQVVTVIEEIATTDLQLSLDPSLLAAMKDQKTIASLDLVDKVKNYFSRAVESSRKDRTAYLESDLFMLTLTRLYIGFGFESLSTAIAKNDARSIKTGNMIVNRGTQVAQGWAGSVGLGEEEKQMQELVLRIQADPLDTREKVEQLQREVEDWFDQTIESDLVEWGYEKKQQ